MASWEDPSTVRTLREIPFLLLISFLDTKLMPWDLSIVLKPVAEMTAFFNKLRTQDNSFDPFVECSGSIVRLHKILLTTDERARIASFDATREHAVFDTTFRVCLQLLDRLRIGPPSPGDVQAMVDCFKTEGRLRGLRNDEASKGILLSIDSDYAFTAMKTDAPYANMESVLGAIHEKAYLRLPILNSSEWLRDSWQRDAAEAVRMWHPSPPRLLALIANSILRCYGLHAEASPAHDPDGVSLLWTKEKISIDSFETTFAPLLLNLSMAHAANAISEGFSTFCDGTTTITSPLRAFHLLPHSFEDILLYLGWFLDQPPPSLVRLKQLKNKVDRRLIPKPPPSLLRTTLFQDRLEFFLFQTVDCDSAESSFLALLA